MVVIARSTFWQKHKIYYYKTQLKYQLMSSCCIDRYCKRVLTTAVIQRLITNYGSPHSLDSIMTTPTHYLAPFYDKREQLDKKQGNAKMLIIGIDPGINYTGWAIIQKNPLLYVSSGVIKTKNSETLESRLCDIASELEKIILLYHPTICGLEEIFINKNPASSLKLAYARGVVISVIGKYKMQMMEFSAKTVKKTITGTGAADKMQVQRMSQFLFPQSKISSEDESDALAIAYAAAMHIYNA